MQRTKSCAVLASRGKTCAPGTSTFVSLDELTSINASAIDEGDGGKVVVWADDHTSSLAFDFEAVAVRRGDGGLSRCPVTTTLDFGSTVDLYAAYGQNGTLLLDPLNVIIGGIGASGISAASIQSALATSNVIVTTGATGLGMATSRLQPISRGLPAILCLWKHFVTSH